MNSAPMTRRRLGRADFIHLAARPVRLVVDRGTLWVTQDGEPEDIEIDAGGQRDFDGHARLTIGTLGGETELRLVPLPRPPSKRLSAMATLLSRLCAVWPLPVAARIGACRCADRTHPPPLASGVVCRVRS